MLTIAGLHVVTPDYNGRRSRDSEGLHRYVEISREPRPKARLLHRCLCRRWGGLRSVEQLQAIFIYRQAHLFPERVFLSRIGDYLTAEGRIGDKEVLSQLRGQAEGFISL